MPLTVSRANALSIAINEAFASIGKTGAAPMPRSRRNDEPIAWEYHVAAHLARVAEARKKLAHREAVKAGVLIDHEKTPLPVGSNALIYAGDLVEIACSVSTPMRLLDVEAFVDALVESGVKRVTVEKLRALHTHDSRAPHKFVSTLVTKALP